jgi:D-sedoheptulose 7-phosphate isomerase
MIERIQKHIQRSIETKQQILNDSALLQILLDAASACAQSLRQGGKILFAGNGGSASDAQHISAELVGRYRQERPSLAAIALTTDTSALTAIGNDYGYEEVFARQVRGLANAGDILVGISTSGNSANILKAVAAAREKGCRVVGLSGPGGKLKECSDYCLCVPNPVTATIQESHIMLGHLLCDLIEKQLYPELE